MNRNHVFDSNGPDIRLRGTAQQLFEKYLQLGRDATGAGDRVTAEGYFQHAEHYFRILNAMSQQQQGNQQQHQRRFQGQPDANDGPDGIGDQPDTAAHAHGAPNGNGQANGAHVNGHAPDEDSESEAPPPENREPV